MPKRGLAKLRLVVVVLAAVATIIGLAPAASAAYGVQPVGPAWAPPGAVWATAVSADGGTVYVGGSYSADATTPSVHGFVASLDGASGTLNWLVDTNGDVRALALTGDGHLLLGGYFTTVGGVTHRKLASMSTGGVVDAKFKAAVGGTVRDIVVVGSTAYFGGTFTSQNGVTQQGLGAVDVNPVSATYGKAVTTFTPSTNGNVYALATDGIRLFVGGQFTAVNGQVRNQLASVTLATNTLDAWNPVKACSGASLYWDMTLDTARNRLYAVGRNCAAVTAVDTISGARIFRVTANGDTQAVTLAPDGLLYVGGHFGTITSAAVARTIVANFDVSATTPVLGPFSARFVTTYPGVWAMASTSSRLYVGGAFTAAGDKVGGVNKYPFFAMFPSA